MLNLKIFLNQLPLWRRNSAKKYKDIVAEGKVFFFFPMMYELRQEREWGQLKILLLSKIIIIWMFLKNVFYFKLYNQLV